MKIQSKINVAREELSVLQADNYVKPSKKLLCPRTKCSTTELGLCIVGIARVEGILVGAWVIILMGDSY